MAQTSKTIGVVLSDRVTAGLIIDHELTGPLCAYPESDDNESALVEIHTEGLVRTICKQVMRAVDGHKGITAVGVAVPGIVRCGIVEDSPNLPQLKGAKIAELLTCELRSTGLDTTVHVLNDADGMAAGLAATTGKLDSFIRVWTLGVGIGYGCYPFTPGIWEGGHTTVTLDDKENYCGCGGRGHIEGIMGHRAMRLRFLDMEPEEVFATARAGKGPDATRCRDFVRLWHKALAAGIATSIHRTGPGRFFITGFNAGYVDLALLKEYVHHMVKMSPLQGYTLEVVEENALTRVIGAAVAAEQAAHLVLQPA